ncbi:MAG: hypothetical protein F6K25_30380 [Okeania sp. SIO2G4]|uniref:DUF2808 domain-containing protein n=3 Tax=Microcoleaceae TaxID=1892252 RepID=A0A3N6PHT7_9CYAN|nr:MULTISPECIES: hypothetical protein [unclassified Okeania]NEP43513.1 hypothetical protein [Okeania sp. SIO2H7]NET22736.1 hypothetical protein [Okeania sp. SIO1H5]RQH55381.1 hypothetical protein D5R40_02225 [Okeania hirsuta]NEP75871.1 hypothetical protein [Okeania sp. SIO2G5]NEP97050.1 hypothetical protein [Okeania sp. SIO2F5]
MKKALGKVIVAFFVCLLSFAVVSPSHAMAAQYYCYLGQQPQCVEDLPESGDLLFVDIPPYGVNAIDVTVSNYSQEYYAIFNTDLGNPIELPPYKTSEVITYPVQPSSSATFSNASRVTNTPIRITVVAK